MMKLVSIPIARETQRWLEHIYDAGAVTVDQDGTVTIDPKVRNLIEKMHEELAAGDPKKKDELEQAFDDALAATSELNGDLGAGVLSV